VKSWEFEGKILWNEFCPFHEITVFTLTLLYKVLRSENSEENSEESRLLTGANLVLRPALWSDSETDFPRPVRSAKRSRFAATVFVRSNPVNWVRILPQMFMFLTDTTKTDFLHILVRTHLLVLTCQHSCMLLVIIDQIYRKRSRSILIMV